MARKEDEKEIPEENNNKYAKTARKNYRKFYEIRRRIQYAKYMESYGLRNTIILRYFDDWFGRIEDENGGKKITEIVRELMSGDPQENSDQD